MNILLVDDEKYARDRLRRFIDKLSGDYTVVGEADNGQDAITQCLEKNADLVLLDVRMPDLDGLTVAKQLTILEPPPAVILVTAFPDYALDAFACNVADYLVKPVRESRLRKALERLRIKTRAQCDDVITKPSHRRHITTYYRGSLQTVVIDDIIYFLADQKYVIVRHVYGKVLIDESLKALEHEFSDLLLRIHRNALVTVSRLIGLEKQRDGSYVAILKDTDERLFVSRRHLSDVRRFLRARC
jgi:two-component system response regulator AlgR